MTPDSAIGKPRSLLVGRLADEMAERWGAGEMPATEEYLDRHPELWREPNAALELIAEELALRHEHGAAVSRTELTRRFPAWRLQVEMLWQCQHALETEPERREPPESGDALGEFRLLSELGRGAHGTVFLATQPALGRAVVLKLAPALGGEHLSLARLQHSHIVPLYSVHEFPDHRLRGLCLPYFGGTTLAALLTRLANVPASSRTGTHVLTALRAVERESLLPLAVSGPGCDALLHESYSAAICRIGACLADALAYAHSRGLLHLDVKPSNVLIAADGEPMLLDFHLARAPVPAGSEPAWLGGTAGYVAPELAAAVDAVRLSEPVPTTVDARADVYSLGVLLREALGFDVPANRSVISTGLQDVLARCTAANPADRYPGAAELAADLRRHLAHLPLRGVPNRSLAERWRKWRRRSPFALPAVLVGTAVTLFAIGFGVQFQHRLSRAEIALRDGESHLQRGRYSEAVEVLRGGESVLRDVPFTSRITNRIHDARQQAERAQAAKELHQFCERIRPLYAAETIALPEIREAARRCRELWGERQQIAERLAGQPTAELEAQWRANLLDVGILNAHLRARLAASDSTGAAHREALVILDEAESLLGASGVLHQERAVRARAIGDPTRAAEAERLAASLPPRTAWEYLIAGRADFSRGDYLRAATEFDRCLDLDPSSLWGNNYRGLCLLHSRDFSGAASAFSACVAVAPRTAWCYAHRGMALAECNQTDRAAADFDRALAIDPDCAAAIIGRAAIHRRAGRVSEALADLRRARDAGVSPATVLYHTAAVHLAAGDRNAALTALRDCLSHDPAHAEAKAAVTQLEGNR